MNWNTERDISKLRKKAYLSNLGKVKTAAPWQKSSSLLQGTLALVYIVSHPFTEKRRGSDWDLFQLVCRIINLQFFFSNNSVQEESLVLRSLVQDIAETPAPAAKETQNQAPEKTWKAARRETQCKGAEETKAQAPEETSTNAAEKKWTQLTDDTQTQAPQDNQIHAAMEGQTKAAKTTEPLAVDDGGIYSIL